MHVINDMMERFSLEEGSEEEHIEGAEQPACFPLFSLVFPFANRRPDPRRVSLADAEVDEMEMTRVNFDRVSNTPRRFKSPKKGAGGFAIASPLRAQGQLEEVARSPWAS